MTAVENRLSILVLVLTAGFVIAAAFEEVSASLMIAIPSAIVGGILAVLLMAGAEGIQLAIEVADDARRASMELEHISQALRTQDRTEGNT